MIIFLFIPFPPFLMDSKSIYARNLSSCLNEVEQEKKLYENNREEAKTIRITDWIYDYVRRKGTGSDYLSAQLKLRAAIYEYNNALSLCAVQGLITQEELEQQKIAEPAIDYPPDFAPPKAT